MSDFWLPAKEALEPYIKSTPLTEKLLGRPPFRYLFDLITEFIRETGWGDDLLSPDELNIDSLSDKAKRGIWLKKIIDHTITLSGISLEVKPSKILAGMDANLTCEFLEVMAKSLTLSKEVVTSTEQPQALETEHSHLEEQKVEEIIRQKVEEKHPIENQKQDRKQVEQSFQLDQINNKEALSGDIETTQNNNKIKEQDPVVQTQIRQTHEPSQAEQLIPQLSARPDPAEPPSTPTSHHETPLVRPQTARRAPPKRARPSTAAQLPKAPIAPIKIDRVEKEPEPELVDPSALEIAYDLTSVTNDNSHHGHLVRDILATKEDQVADTLVSELTKTVQLITKADVALRGKLSGLNEDYVTMVAELEEWTRIGQKLESELMNSEEDNELVKLEEVLAQLSADIDAKESSISSLKERLVVVQKEKREYYKNIVQ
ncbi:hypothetical protein RCL1_005120 [Eukaryota sp. TZLM3-RCL]